MRYNLISSLETLQPTCTFTPLVTAAPAHSCAISTLNWVAYNVRAISALVAFCTQNIIFQPFIVGTVFIRQNLTYVDVRF